MASIQVTSTGFQSLIKNSFGKYIALTKGAITFQCWNKAHYEYGCSNLMAITLIVKDI